MRGLGFAVVVKATDELAEMSREAGIPDAFQGCHLSFVDGYVVSGHVPAGIVRKLLSERPDIGGVTLPGMPMGLAGHGRAQGRAVRDSRHHEMRGHRLRVRE